MATVALFTPPFSQLNTPYSAMPFLAGTLREYGHNPRQFDVGISIFLRLFCSKGLARFFTLLQDDFELDTELSTHYQRTIDQVITYLQGKWPEGSASINGMGFLPEGPRFNALEELGDIFLEMSIEDQAHYRASLYIDDLTDLMQQTILPGFGLSKYNDRLGMSARTFDAIEESLSQSDLIDTLIGEYLSEMDFEGYDLCAITVPFPGNLFGALSIGRWFKKNYSMIPVVLGGGYVNSELRELTDTRIFDYCDYICFDDGERPLLQLLEYLKSGDTHALYRTMVKGNTGVQWCNNTNITDIHVNEVGVPDYGALDLTQYITLYESFNPMHTLWSQKGWLKLRAAHGCYWKKCSFCDVSLDYIARYQSASIEYLVNTVESIVAETGCRTFHFVDEAFPPKSAKLFSLEVIRRGLDIEWWGNIRFETAYTQDVAFLMARAGCVAVTGGLEAVTNSVLDAMNKGVSTESAATTAGNFARAGVLTHAYLIYSFPGQVIQDGVDALEIIRQMYSCGVIDSTFWHRFSLTTHSPVAKNPEVYGVEYDATPAPFANNDLPYSGGGSIDVLADGLKKANYNFMYGAGVDNEIASWFDCEVPSPTVAKNFIEQSLMKPLLPPKGTKRVVWLGGAVQYTKSGSTQAQFTCKVNGVKTDFAIPYTVAAWCKKVCTTGDIKKQEQLSWNEALSWYPSGTTIVEDLIESEFWFVLKNAGLVVI
ncbi:MAG: radical SAM protein [Fibrobacterales bacterium]